MPTMLPDDHGRDLPGIVPSKHTEKEVGLVVGCEQYNRGRNDTTIVMRDNAKFLRGFNAKTRIECGVLTISSRYLTNQSRGL